MNSVHIIRIEGEWWLTAAGGSRVIGVFKTKEDAIGAASRLFTRFPVTVKIHGPGGTVEEQIHEPSGRWTFEEIV